MKFNALHLITLGTAILLTACEGGETGTTTELGDALDTLAAEAEQEALRRHGVQDADVEAADEEEAAGEPLPEEGEAPVPGERIEAFCAERSAEVLARCEARRAEAAEAPADAPACEEVAAAAEQHCVRRAVRHVRHRLHAHAETCRDEARAAARTCVDEGGDRATCREAAIEGARACLEAAPDRPERPEGEARPEGERPRRGDRGEGAEGEGAEGEGEGAEDEGAEDEGDEG
jgi:hypothetical protein